VRLAVSNIAWTADEDYAVHAALVESGIDAIEVAPTRMWADPGAVPRGAGEAEAARLLDQGLEVVSFQSLLFARPDLTVFDDQDLRATLVEYLRRITVLAGAMGAGRMVFGSPKSRQVPVGMSPDEAFDVAVGFFRAAGDAAAAEGTMLCIEPNPPEYACNFVTTGAQGAALVEAVDSPGFGLHLDAAGLVLAGDDPASAARAAGSLVQHVHASAPQLGELESEVVDHRGFGAALHDIGYDRLVSIEMRAGAPGDNVSRVLRGVALARDSYTF
jgi:D-psicose/D-tagatose/L-ribulose 3-epimerase